MSLTEWFWSFFLSMVALVVYLATRQSDGGHYD